MASFEGAEKPIEMAFAHLFVKRKVGLSAALRAALLAALLLAGGMGSGAAAEAFDTSAYARVLERYVTPEGKVRYAALKKDPADLEAFVEQLAAVSPENRPDLFPTPAAQRAYWINTYNAFVLQAVVNAYPVSSVRDLKFGFGLLFFKRAQFVAGGRKLSLDDIEHGILRARFHDPRIHFALNCASASCPPLAREPYRPETLDVQLDEAARAFIGREENVWMRGDVLFLSKIFDWYKEDFVQAAGAQGNGTASVVDYVVRYLPEEVARRVRQEKPRVEFYNYDWSLNNAGGRAD